MSRSARILLFGLGLILISPLSAAAQEGNATSAEAVHGVQHALLVGNDAYLHWPPLKTAVRDAEGIRDVLVRRYGFSEGNIILVRNATRRQMLKSLDQLRERSRPEDTVLVYYAGHGMYDEKQDGFWVPVDGEVENNYDYISNADVLNRLGAIDARHKLLISDSCFSGNLLTRGLSQVDTQVRQAHGYYQQKSLLKSVQGFTSGGNEPVFDGGPKWQGHSVFAYHLIAQLEANQQPYLSASELGMTVAEYVSNDTMSLTGSAQTPILQPIRNQGDQGGEFFFTPSASGEANQRMVSSLNDRVYRRSGEAAEGATNPEAVWMAYQVSGWTLLGLAVASTATAGWTYAMALEANSSADATLPLARESAEAEAELRQHEKERDEMANFAIISGAIAGATLVASIVVLALSPSAPEPEESVEEIPTEAISWQLGGAPIPDGGVFTLGGRF